jgi:hypothetical protein
MTSVPATSIREALRDPQLLGTILRGESWTAWRVLLIAAMGEKLTKQERILFQQLTQREREPLQRIEEFIGVVGRRGGKSRAISVIASYPAALCQHPALVPGERGVVLIVAADQRQAQIVLDYVEANFASSHILKQLVAGRTQRALRLSNGIDIEVRASDYRSVRGLSFIAAIADELAFWAVDQDSASPDHEILNAVRPGLATTGGPLFMISSPYARGGALWDLFNRHYGPEGDKAILVARGSTRTFNPSLEQFVIDRAYERDPAAAAAEYGAEFRTDLESFVNADAVQNCVVVGLYERAPQRGVQYQAFTDPSGGSADGFSLCIGHVDHSRNRLIVIDAIREAIPGRTGGLNPAGIVEEFSRLLSSYRCGVVYGDKYAGMWPVEQFARFSIRYEQSAKPKSDLYVDLLPLLNSGQIHLLDHPRTVQQLCSLERRTARSGRDSIDHPPNAHDDCANAVAGLASILTNQPSINYQAWSGNSDADPHGVEAWRRAARAHYYESHGLSHLGHFGPHGGYG